MKKFLILISIICLIGLAGCTMSLDFHPEGKSSGSTK